MALPMWKIGTFSVNLFRSSPQPLAPRHVEGNFSDWDPRVTFRTLDHSPASGYKFKVPCVFFSFAVEAERKLSLRELTFDFHGTGS